MQPSITPALPRLAHHPPHTHSHTHIPHALSHPPHACALLCAQARLHEAQGATARAAQLEAENVELVRRILEMKSGEADRLNDINRLEAQTVRCGTVWRCVVGGGEQEVVVVWGVGACEGGGAG